MLPWLPKKLNKRQLFFFRLLTFVFVCHIIFLAAYFICSRSKVMTINMQMQKVDLSRPITVIPFVRRTGQLKRLIQSSLKNQKDVKETSLKSIPKKIVSPPKKKKAVVVKKVPPKKMQPLKKEHAKEVKKVEPSKKDAKEVEDKNKKEKKIEKKVEEKLEKSPIAKGLPVEKKDDLTVKTSDEEPVVLGQEEFEALNVYQEVHQELSTHWHPPAGLHPKQPMIVLVTINKDGTAGSMRIEQSSGVLVYDVAARMAIGKSAFPKQLWGQYVRLHF